MSTIAAPAAAVRSRDASRVELIAAFTSLGLMALHVIDDSFLQPEPGTSAGEHLVSGLVPIAAILVAAIAYPRLRAGARATLALFFGALGVAFGAGEAVYYTLNASPSGDDFTGFLALAAGLCLIGVGAVVLWRSRRRDDGLLWRYTRRLLLVFAALLILVNVVLPLTLTYGFTHSARVETTSADLGAPYENVAFTTSDDLRLEGWYVPSKNGASIVAFPGRKGTQRHARMLVKHGYGVLVFDRRGEGTSEGDPNAFGWAFNRDLKAAAAFLETRPDVEGGKIGGIGLSVGGEALLQAGAESRAYDAIVSDGAGSRSYREDMEEPGLSEWLALPSTFMQTVGTSLWANQAPPPSIKDLTPRISPTPVFFVYAGHGAGGEDNNPQYYEVSGEPKQIWKIADASHTHGLRKHPEEYERRVVAFFDNTLQPS
jgi:dienelactone hydrolase